MDKTLSKHHKTLGTLTAKNNLSENYMKFDNFYLMEMKLSNFKKIKSISKEFNKGKIDSKDSIMKNFF